MSESSNPAVSPDLVALRERIDELDRQLIDVLSRRLDVCRDVARLKDETDMPVIQPRRVREVLTSRRQWAIDRSIDPDFVEEILRVVLAETHRIEVAGRRTDGAPDKSAESNRTQSAIDEAMDTVATRIDHVVVAVADLDRAVETFTSEFGFHLLPDVAHRAGVAVVATGGVTLVLVGPDAGPDVARHLEIHGSGLHHVAIEVLNAGLAHSVLAGHRSNVSRIVVDEQGHEQFFTVRDDASGLQFGFLTRTGHRHGVATTNVLEAFRQSSPDA